MNWERHQPHCYTAHGADVTCVVQLLSTIDAWGALVCVRGETVHMSEHESRDDAMDTPVLAAKRACAIRRFQSDRPSFL